MRVRIFGIVASIPLALLGIATTGCGVKKPEPTAAAAAPPPGPSVKPEVQSAKSSSDIIRENLHSVRKLLIALRQGVILKQDADKDLLAAVNELLKLSDSARQDTDAIIRSVEDLLFALPGAEIGYKATAARYVSEAQRITDPRMQKIHLQTAGSLLAEAADVPRRKSVSEEFLRKALDTRRLLAESVYTLQGQKVRIEIDLNAHKRPKLNFDSVTYVKQFEQWIALLEEFEKEFGKPAPPVPLPELPAKEAPKEKDPFKGTEEK